MNAKRFGTGSFFVITAIVFGFFLGGFLGGRVFGGDGMGWDQIADALGGVMVGVLVALVGALLLVSRLSDRQHMVVGGLFLIGAALVILVLRLLGPAEVTSGLPGQPPLGASILFIDLSRRRWHRHVARRPEQLGSS